MAIIGYNNARKNKRSTRKASSNGGQNQSLDMMTFEAGERKRVIIPVIDGSVVLFAKPYHKVLNESVQLISRAGNPYNIFQVRCTHPYSQVSPEESIESAKTKEICLFCDLAKYESRRVWDIINSEYGDKFKDLEKSEQREVFKKIEGLATVEPSFYKTKDEDGNETNATQMEIYMLILELELDGKKPVLDANGIPKYKPTIMKASKSRLEKFRTGVEDAIESGLLDDDMLHSYIENEGTEDEERVSVGWVDFNVNFPQSGGDKKESGKAMSATPVSEKMSVITQAFIDAVQNDKELVKQAKSAVDNRLKNFKMHTREEALDMLADQVVDGVEVSGKQYFADLEAKYRFKGDDEHKSDDERDAEIFEKVLQFDVSSKDEEVAPKEEEKVAEKEDGDAEAKAKKAELLKKRQEALLKKKQEEAKAKEELDEDEFDDLDDLD